MVCQQEVRERLRQLMALDASLRTALAEKAPQKGAPRPSVNSAALVRGLRRRSWTGPAWLGSITENGQVSRAEWPACPRMTTSAYWGSLDAGVHCSGLLAGCATCRGHSQQAKILRNSACFSLKASAWPVLHMGLQMLGEQHDRRPPSQSQLISSQLVARILVTW